QKHRGDDIDDRHPRLRRRRCLGRGRVSEHERRDDTDAQRRDQRAKVEEDARAERPLAEDEREDRKRQGCRRHHRGERHEHELGVNPAHSPSPRCSASFSSSFACLLTSFFSILFSFRSAFASAAFTFASAYDSPTSCFPPVQPKTMTTRTIATIWFHAVVMSCCAVE